MGLVVTLKIAEINENRMFLKRSRFPKAMGGMLLGLSFVFIVMYKAASVYIWLLYYSSAIIDKALFFVIIISFIAFPLLGFFLLFYDKKIEVDKKLEVIYIRFKFMFIPIWRTKIKFTKIDEIVIENVCKSETVAMRRASARGTGKGIRAGYWLMSLKGKELGKLYFDRHPKKEEILSYAENLSRLTSKKITMIEK
ncbi:MAG: hypothetical protein SCARUB_01730 [Candidatus Scalindua rubra]|uniref:Uncharacterized protein n=1 Tax=Candidatus Scalindua rubra TaxID=1872076 RepID=A0A1E3XBW5_9BACT|nr:MAG: hypothetical protein SCARUB_01730 [Candidatus Scalindua rubra]